MAVENDLGRDKISRLVWRIAIPSMLGQFVSVLYSIVDRMYIGNIPEIGDVALAGVGVCGPVVTMVGSVAVLVGVGGAPLVSIRMGEEDLSAAKKVLANCFLMLLVFSVLLIGGILLPGAHAAAVRRQRRHLLCRGVLYRLLVRHLLRLGGQRLKPVHHLPGLCQIGMAR